MTDCFLVGGRNYMIDLFYLSSRLARGKKYLTLLMFPNLVRLFKLILLLTRIKYY